MRRKTAFALMLSAGLLALVVLEVFGMGVGLLGDAA